MKSYITSLLLIICVTFMSGCSSKLMSTSMIDINQETLADDASSVIFYRNSILGGGIQAPIAEYIDGDVKFVGISSYNQKFRFITTPGKHIFVVGGESGAILKADLLPQMNYYVRVEPYMGLFKARFELEAVHFNELEGLKEKIVKCVLVAPNANAEVWFENNKNSMQKKAIIGLEKFEKRENKSPLLLNQEDGVIELY